MTPPNKPDDVEQVAARFYKHGESNYYLPGQPAIIPPHCLHCDLVAALSSERAKAEREIWEKAAKIVCGRCRSCGLSEPDQLGIHKHRLMNGALDARCDAAAIRRGGGG